MSAPTIRTPNRGADSDPLTLLFYRPTQAARVLNLSRSVVFELLRSGRLRSVQEGRTRLIPEGALREYIDLLEREAATK